MKLKNLELIINKKEINVTEEEKKLENQKNTKILNKPT